MKNNIDRKYELLSAYVDNELSDHEIRKIEEYLKASPDLREKLDYLKKVKRITSSSVNIIKENPYFETRVAASIKIKEPLFLRFKRFYPLTAIIALSLAVMVVLKYNPNIINSIVEKQKSNIAGFYKQNLKPLLYVADLTNEDIFNFAFYHQLPLDSKKQQYLFLSSNSKGGNYFEISNNKQKFTGNNLNKFIKGLNLNNTQEKQVDSILARYADNLQSQVLVNEENTVAINPNIWNFNKALVADLVSFAAKVNHGKLQNIFPAGDYNLYSNASMPQLVDEVSSANNNNYIFITPDTVFSDSFYFDKRKYKDEMKKFRDQMEKMNKGHSNFVFNFPFDSNLIKLNNLPSFGGNFKVYMDSNSFRIHVPDMIVPQFPMQGFDSIATKLSKAGDIFKLFSFNFPEMKKGKNFNYRYFYSDSANGVKFKSFGFDSTFGLGHRKFDKLYGKNFKNYKFANPDSLNRFLKFFFSDSTAYNQKELQEELQQVQRQIEQFQKQMQQFQKQIPNKSFTPKTVKQIEI